MKSVPFLKEIAEILLTSGDIDLLNTCIVFPNKRARIYLSKYISEITDKPVWAPRYFTINELMEEVSGYIIADKFELLFELFEAYLKVTKSNENFDTFYPYAETILSDFDEIDKYLVNAEDIFQNLAGLKSLEGKFNYLSEDQLMLIGRFWKTFNIDHSNDQKKFTAIWDSLLNIYNEFVIILKQRKLAYEGMAYRKAIETLNENNSPLNNFRKFIFIGFNALNKCEEKLFIYLRNKGIAEFYWDYDSWYLNNEIHEAGFFMRKNLKDFPQNNKTNHDHLLKPRNKIFSVPVFSNSGQAAIIPQVLDKIKVNKNSQSENTAIVLADESLLMSVIYSMPDDIKDFNVTISFPITGSGIYSLINSLYELGKNAKNVNGIISWHYKDILAVMNNDSFKHHYINEIEKVKDYAINRHIIYFKKDQITSNDNDPVFNNISCTNTFAYLVDLIEFLIKQSFGPEITHNAVQTEILFKIYTLLIRLHDIMKVKKYNPGPDVVFRIVKKIVRTMHIPFSGEPLAGLQILGILETRTLDFENVIILSSNEGILPKLSDRPSFIPYNLRAGFGLPTPEHHDAIYAYYFYRLIQRASNIVLIYNATANGLQTGERSRFLHQLIFEMKLPVEELNVQSSIAQLPIKTISIDKTGNILSSLNNYLNNENRILSPNAINAFLNCPLKFYFTYIAGLQQTIEIEEEIDSRMFGNIMHNTLRLLFTDFGNLPITKEKIENIYKNDNLIYTIIDKSFHETLFGHADDVGTRKIEGFNLIVKQVIFTYIKQFLKAEINFCPFTILSLEKKYITTIQCNVNGNLSDIYIGGIIDRIDRYEGKIRILDYKTGKVKEKFDSVESLFFDDNELRNDAAFQVLLYSYIYNNLYSEETIVPGLFYIRQSHSEDFSSSIYYGNKKGVLNDFNDVKEEFEKNLKISLANLFNYNEPFKQTDNLKNCKFCPYALICRREE